MLTKTQASVDVRRKPSDVRIEVSNSYQLAPACFNPYRLFLRITWRCPLASSILRNLGSIRHINALRTFGKVIMISSCSSACKYAAGMSTVAIWPSKNFINDT